MNSIVCNKTNNCIDFHKISFRRIYITILFIKKKYYIVYIIICYYFKSSEQKSRSRCTLAIENSLTCMSNAIIIYKTPNSPVQMEQLQCGIVKLNLQINTVQLLTVLTVNHSLYITKNSIFLYTDGSNTSTIQSQFTYQCVYTKNVLPVFRRQYIRVTPNFEHSDIDCCVSITK